MEAIESEVLQRITRVEEKVNGMNEKLDRAIAANETAVEALSSAKSAHHRLDRIEDAQKWLWRTIGASIITIVVGAILTVIKLQGGA